PHRTYTLSLHDALPILAGVPQQQQMRQPTTAQPAGPVLMTEEQEKAKRKELFQEELGEKKELLKTEAQTRSEFARTEEQKDREEDRKSTRLNSSHQIIS